MKPNLTRLFLTSASTLFLLTYQVTAMQQNDLEAHNGLLATPAATSALSRLDELTAQFTQEAQAAVAHTSSVQETQLAARIAALSAAREKVIIDAAHALPQASTDEGIARKAIETLFREELVLARIGRAALSSVENPAAHLGTVIRCLADWQGNKASLFNSVCSSLEQCKKDQWLQAKQTLGYLDNTDGLREAATNFYNALQKFSQQVTMRRPRWS